MGKKKGPGRARTADKTTETNNAPEATAATATEAEAADTDRAVLQVDEATGPTSSAGEHVAAAETADLDADVGIQVMATEPDDDRGSQISVLGEGIDGQATQADGDGEQDTAAQGAGDPDQADLAEIGRHFMAGFEVIVSQDGPFKDYTPAENPAELLTDIYAALEEEVGAHKQTQSLLTEAQDAIMGDSAPSEHMPEPSAAEWRVATAWSTASVAYGMPSHKHTASDGGWLGGEEDEMAKKRAEAVAEFIRAHGPAGPETLVIHLRRSGFPDTPEPTGRAAVAWKVFITTLCELDRLAGEEAAAAKASPGSQADARAFGAALGGRGPFEARESGPFDPSGLRLA